MPNLSDAKSPMGKRFVRLWKVWKPTDALSFLADIEQQAERIAALEKVLVAAQEFNHEVWAKEITLGNACGGYALTLLLELRAALTAAETATAGEQKSEGEG